MLDGIGLKVDGNRVWFLIATYGVLNDKLWMNDLELEDKACEFCWTIGAGTLRLMYH